MEQGRARQSRKEYRSTRNEHLACGKAELNTSNFLNPQVRLPWRKGGRGRQG